jgi:hypothetical protein
MMGAPARSCFYNRTPLLLQVQSAAAVAAVMRGDGREEKRIRDEHIHGICGDDVAKGVDVKGLLLGAMLLDHLLQRCVLCFVDGLVPNASQF